jgi:hypothetical protein
VVFSEVLKLKAISKSLTGIASGLLVLAPLVVLIYKAFPENPI